MKIEKVILASTLVVISLIVIVAFFLYGQCGIITDDQKYYVDTVLKMIGGFGVLAVAWWRWHILKTKSDDDAYLKTIEILSDTRSQAAFVGASHSLLDLAKRNPRKYPEAAVVTIESSIRELSEASYNNFLATFDQSTTSKGTLKERNRIPAIEEMLRIVLRLRKDYDTRDNYLPMNLGFADLRNLSVDVINSNKKAFEKANLNRADLRYIDFLKAKPLSGSYLHGAWVNINRENICNEIKNGKNKLADRKEWMDSNQARYFLTGNWSSDVELEDDEMRAKYVDMFVEGRIGGGPGVQFDGMNLAGCDFRYAMLRGASFRNAILTNADFLYADLEGANFTGAIGKAFFEGANTDGAIKDFLE